MDSLPPHLSSWLQGLGLTRKLRSVRLDLCDGYVVAEVLARYFPADVPLVAFGTYGSLERRKSNWLLLQKLFQKGEIPVTGKLVQSVLSTEEGAAVRLLDLLHDYLEGPGSSGSSSKVAAAAGGETPAAGAAAAGQEAEATGVRPSGVATVNEGSADGCQPLNWQVPGHPPAAEFAATGPYELAAGSSAPAGAAPPLAAAQAVDQSGPAFAVGGAMGPMEQLEQHWGEQRALAAGYPLGAAMDGSVWSSAPGCVPMVYPGGLPAFQEPMAGAWEQQQQQQQPQQQLVGAYWGELPAPQPMAMPLVGMTFGASLQAPVPVAQGPAVTMPPGMCEYGWQAAGGPQLEILPSPTAQPWWQEPNAGPQRTECAGTWAGRGATKGRLNAASPACTLPSLPGGHRAAGSGGARGHAAGMQPARHAVLAAKQHMSGGGRAAAGELSPPSPALAAGAVPPPPPELLPWIEYDRRPRPVPVFKPYSHKDMLLKEYDVKRAKGYWELGRLGPDYHDSPEWKAKWERREREKEFGQAARAINLKAAEQPGGPAPRKKAPSSRERALQFARALPRPEPSSASKMASAQVAAQLQTKLWQVSEKDKGLLGGMIRAEIGGGSVC